MVVSVDAKATQYYVELMGENQWQHLLPQGHTDTGADFSDRRLSQSSALAANALALDSDLPEQNRFPSGYEANAAAGPSTGSHQGNFARGLIRSFPRTISLDAEVPQSILFALQDGSLLTTNAVEHGLRTTA